MAIKNSKYLPLLSVRPAEMVALEHLPNKAKDGLSPFIFVRPWVTAKKLDDALVRLEKAFGNRMWIGDVSEEVFPDGDPRPVHFDLAQLRVPTDGFVNWCKFLETRSRIIPSILLGASDAELRLQSKRLRELGRGAVLRLPVQRVVQINEIIESVVQEMGYHNLLVVLDYEQVDRGVLAQASSAINRINVLGKRYPGISIAIAATTFPDSFVAITDQEIFEREFFALVSAGVEGVELIYSDRGSARAERQNGGGGAPAPRVDLPTNRRWSFFREEVDTKSLSGNVTPSVARFIGYQTAASRAKASSDWDARLALWGVQMIERTSLGDATAIHSPPTATAARINIHLYRQLHFGSTPEQLYDTEEEWTDI